jgi:hypothetical protein
MSLRSEAGIRHLEHACVSSANGKKTKKRTGACIKDREQIWSPFDSFGTGPSQP